MRSASVYNIMGSVGMKKDDEILELLTLAADLETMHHLWMGSFDRDIPDVARHIQWMLERTTCIQKEIFKLLGAGYPPSTVLDWGYEHISEEIDALIKDIRDITPDVLRRSVQGTPPDVDIRGEKTRIEAIPEMLAISSEIWTRFDIWSHLRRREEDVHRILVLVVRSAGVQQLLLSAIEEYPDDLPLALETALPLLVRMSRWLRKDRCALEARVRELGEQRREN